jgi:hypothetical protein
MQLRDRNEAPPRQGEQSEPEAGEARVAAPATQRVKPACFVIRDSLEIEYNVVHENNISVIQCDTRVARGGDPRAARHR